MNVLVCDGRLFYFQTDTQSTINITIQITFYVSTRIKTFTSGKKLNTESECKLEADVQ